jgi:hypothetical protein
MFKYVSFSLLLLAVVSGRAQSLPTLTNLVAETRQYAARHSDAPLFLWDNIGWLRKSPAFEDLSTYMATNWTEALSSWKTAAPNEMDETLLVIASQEMPPVEYLQFLQSALPLASQEIIDKQILRRVFLSYNQQEIFWTVKFERADVRRMLELARRTFADDSQTAAVISSFLNGDALQNRKVAITNGIMHAEQMDSGRAQPRQMNTGNTSIGESYPTPASSVESSARKEPQSESMGAVVKSFMAGAIILVCCFILFLLFRKNRSNEK